MGYNDTERLNVIIDEPHPGTFVIRGHNPASIDTDEGRIVPIPECYVAPEVPTSALLFILEKREGERDTVTLPRNVFDEHIQEVRDLKAQIADMLKQRTNAQVEVIKGAATPVFDAPKASITSGLTPEEIESCVIEALAKNDGTMRIGLLAQEIAVPDEEIKAASKFEPCAYEIVSGGWVKLKKTEGAE